MMAAGDLTAILLTLKLASATTFILLCIGPFIAWFLAQRSGFFIHVLEAIVALPLVLPPTVLGFYLLLFFSPNNYSGQLLTTIFGQPLAFTFTGLLIASVLYSLPFVVQPLQAAFKSLDHRLIETTHLLNLSWYERSIKIILPLTLPTFMSAALLAFAHTIGEFGVVLMIGGNIAGETRVISIALFDHVESLDYEAAHRLALGLLLFSMTTLVLVYGFFGRKSRELKWA